MAVFPPGRSLIVPPSQLWSRGAAASMGAPMPNYPAEQAVDGSSGVVARSSATTDHVTVELSIAQTPNVWGVIHHNIDHGNVCLFQSGGLGVDRGAAARRPNFWLDLRGFPATDFHWTFGCNGNSRPLMIGEIVIGTGFEFDGVIEQEPREQTKFWQERQEMEYGKTAISAAKAYQRTMTLSLSIDTSMVTSFEQICDEAWSTGERVVVVPDSRRNDIWFVRWPDRRAFRYRQSAIADVEVILDLLEEVGGVVV